MTPRRSSGDALDSLRRRLEPLWPAVLAIHFVVLGNAIVSPAVVHLLLAVAYLPLVIFMAVPLARLTSRQTASSIRLAIVGTALPELTWLLLFANWISLLTAAMAAIVTVVALGYVGGRQSSHDHGSSFFRILPVLFASALGWMCAASLIWWEEALQWIASTPVTATVTMISIPLVALALRNGGDVQERETLRRWFDYLAIGLLVIFSFRTLPYGRLANWSSIVVPLDLLSRDHPIAFWIVQSGSLAVTATLMYLVLSQVGSKWAAPPFAFVATLATVFFIPLNAQELVAVQVNPSFGALRFMWCFILLTFIGRHVLRDPEKQNTRAFVFLGTAIWLAGSSWSVESAAYCTCIWVASVAVFTAHKARAWRQGQLSTAESRKRIAQILITPLAALAAMVLLVTAAHIVLLQTTPDWTTYLRGEPAGGQPFDRIGPVWLLFLVFALLSTIGAMTLSRSAEDPRLVGFAGMWAGMWAAGYFFVATPEPLRAAALAPLLMFTLAVAVRVMRSDRPHRWHRLVLATVVPAFAMPIATIVGHPRFAAELTRPQVAPTALHASDASRRSNLSAR